MGLNLGIRVRFPGQTHAYVLQALGGVYLMQGSAANLTSTVRTPIAYALTAGVGSYSYSGTGTVLTYTQPGVTPQAPQAIWNGGFTSNRARMTLWPPADGSNPDGYNFYRSDMPLGPGVPLNTAVGLVVPHPSGTNGILYASWTDTGLTPSSPYSYFARSSVGGVESGNSPTLSIVTLDATGCTPPAAVTAPETYIPGYILPSGLVWTANQNTLPNQAGNAGPKNNQNCGLQYALNNAGNGDIIVCTSGLVYTNAIGTAAFTVPATLSNIWIVSDQEPLYNAAGLLPRYSYIPDARYTPFTATGTILAGATSLNLTSKFLRRTGWYTTKFASSNPSGIETLPALYTQGSTLVVWDIGLQANCTANLLVGLGNHVSPWDAGIGIAGGNINPSPTMPILQYNQTNNNDGNGFGALVVHGDNVRVVGICIQPVANNVVVNQFINCSAVAGDAVGVMFDRCVIGRNNLVSTRSYFDRCCASSGTNVVFHQCYLFGCDAGPEGTDAHTVLMAANGPLCIQNCYLESTTENTFVGGGYVAQANLEHDETIRYNYSHKPTSWQQVTTIDPQNGNTVSLSQRVKNHMEIKSGSRFEYYGNLIQNNAFLNDSQGQQGRAFPLTARDQVSSAATQTITGLTAVGTLATAILQFAMPAVAMPPGTKFWTTISGANNAAYNGSFTCTVVNSTTFTYNTLTPPGGIAGGAPKYQRPPQAGGMWESITDVHIHDNQVYGVGQLTYLASNADFNPCLFLARVWIHNNICWDNPAMTDNLGQKTKLVWIDCQGYTPDVKINNNLHIAINAGTGYADPTITKGIQEIVAGPNDVLQDRWVVVDNIVDGTVGGYLSIAGAPPFNPNNGATDGAWITHAFNSGNLVFNKNIYLTDTGAYPGSVHVVYGSVGFDNFVSKTTMPVSPTDWNVTSGTYASDSTTGESRGTFFYPPPVATDPAPRTFWQVINPNNPSGAGTSYANATFQTNAAKFNIVNPGPYINIEQDMGNTTFPTIFANIKSLAKANGINCRCIHYVNSSNQSATATSGGSGSQTNGGTYYQWTAAISAAKWWLLTSYPSGSIVIDSFGASDGSRMQQSNQNTALDSNNRTFAQGFWNHYDGVLRMGQSTVLGYPSGKAMAVNRYLDGYQMDNVMCQPRETGAWQNTTTSFTSHWPSSADPQISTWLQQGIGIHVMALRAINPKIMILGNCDYYVHSTTNFSYQVALDPSQIGLFDVVYCQAVIGMSTSIEGQGTTTTAQVMQNLIAAEVMVAPGGSLIVEQCGRNRTTAFTSTNQASWVAADWQAARFGMAFTMMRDYMYALNNQEDYRPDRVYFLDEMLQQNGMFGWLGVGGDPPQSAARTAGVWYRVYPGGVVFMNPKGNGTQVVNLTALGLTGYKTCASNGFGDLSINPVTPVSVTSITLSDRDGRFLTI